VNLILIEAELFQFNCFYVSMHNTTCKGGSSKFRGGAISVIFNSQVSLRVHYYRRDEVYFTILL